MDNLYKLIAVFVLLFSTSIFADTYSASTGWYVSACSSASFACWGQNYPDASTACMALPYISSTQPKFYANGGCYYDSQIYYPTTRLYCPGGGSLSGTSCVNATSCAVNQVRDVTTKLCRAVVSCLAPETDNGFGICAVKECTGATVLNGTTGQCQTPPTCGSTETYDNASNTCKLYPLNCPGHSHANTANDKCLPDAPLTCPIGMHDDGTYACVANDATACKSNQIKGYIFGIPQCINKTNVDQFAKQAADVAATKAASAARVAASQAAADAAAAEAAADPTNTTKQAANTVAQTTNTTNITQLAKDTTAATDAQNSANQAALKSIADSTKSMDDREAAAEAAGFGTIPAAEAIPTTNATMSAVSETGTGLFTGSGACPAPANIVLSFKTISMSYQPYCDFASMISPLVISLAWFSAGLIVLGSIKD